MKKPDKKWPLLVAAVIFAVAILRLPVNNEMREGFIFAVRVGSVFLCAAFLMEINVWAGMLLLLALFSHSLPMFVLSGFDFMHTKQSYLALDAVLTGCAIYVVIVLKCRDINPLLNMICIIAMFQTLFLVVQNFGFDPYVLFGLIGEGANTGLMTNPNESAAFLALCSPAFFRGRLAWGLIFIVIGLALSCSTGGVLGFGLAAMFYISMRGLFWVTLPLIIMTGLFLAFIDNPLTSSESITDRFGWWSDALKLQHKNNGWWFGIGLGNWKLIYPELARAGVLKAGCIRLHNSFVQGIVEMGILFPVIVIGYMINTVKRYTSRALLPCSAMFSIFATGMTNSLFRMNAINSMVAVAWFAMLHIKLQEE